VRISILKREAIMSEQFKVGEVVIGCNHISHPEYNGCEAVVTSPLEFADGINLRTGERSCDFRYTVWWADGSVTRALPVHLRRRKPPAADSNERTFMQKWRDMADKAPQRVEVPA
jgi:hypothetical protein